jgi:hypothetical protein
MVGFHHAEMEHRMKTTNLLLAGLLAAAACTGALAQDTATGEAQIEAATGPVTVTSVQPPIGNASDYQVKVADIDANGDGVVSKKEVPTNHALFFEFRLVDTNRNGRITDEELANWK